MILHNMDSVGSTNDEARRLANTGAAHGTAVLARQQTAGRGRQGRVWVSPPGNLHLSIVLRPEVELRRVPEIGFVAALAVAATVDALLGRAAATLKWPNDVMIDANKLAGLLLELAGAAVILGIGANIAHAPADLPYPVVALAQLGCPATAAEVAQALLPRLENGLAEWQRGGFEPVRQAWLARGPLPGAALQARQGTAMVSGRFVGLDPGGALLMDTANGRQRLVAGEIVPS